LCPNSLNIDIGVCIEIDVGIDRDVDIAIEIDVGARSTPLSFLSEWFAPGLSPAPSSEGSPKSTTASDGNAGCEPPGRIQAKGIHSNPRKVLESFPGTLGTGGDSRREGADRGMSGAGGFEAIIERCGRMMSGEYRRI
jgi:hypothetical protein